MASKTAKGKVLRTPRTSRGSLEEKFYNRFGRDPDSREELDRFASTLSNEARTDAASARDERVSVVNTVLGHNLRERTYMENRAAQREEIMMQRDKKFLRRMIREWKKEQPHGIHTLDRGQEWLPGSVIYNPDRKIRFRSKQEAIDFTQANKPQRTALVGGAELDATINAMVNAERKARDDAAAEAASAPVNAAEKAGDSKKGPLYDYQFQKKAGEGFDAMMKRLESEVNAAADAQFSGSRASRAQRADERRQRAEGRQLAVEVNAGLDEMFPDKSPSKSIPKTPVTPVVKAPDIPFPFDPVASLPKGDSDKTSTSPTQATAEKPSAPAQKPETAVQRQARINAEREKELDLFAREVDAKSKTDPFYTKSEERKVFDKTVRNLKNGDFGAEWRDLKRGVKFTLVNDFGISPSTLSSIGSFFRGDSLKGANVKANPESVAHRSAGLADQTPAKKSNGRPGRIRPATREDFKFTPSVPAEPVNVKANKVSVAHRSAGLWTSPKDQKKSGRKHQ